MSDPNNTEEDDFGEDMDMDRRDATAVLDRDSISAALAAIDAPDEVKKRLMSQVQGEAVDAPAQPTELVTAPRRGGRSLTMPILIGVTAGIVIALVLILFVL